MRSVLAMHASTVDSIARLLVKRNRTFVCFMFSTHMHRNRNKEEEESDRKWREEGGGGEELRRNHEACDIKP